MTTQDWLHSSSESLAALIPDGAMIAGVEPLRIRIRRAPASNSPGGPDPT